MFPSHDRGMQPRRQNILEIRNFAQSPWVQMAITTIKKQVKDVPFDMVLADENSEEDIADYETEIEKVKDFLDECNSNGEDIYELADPLITDLGEIDAGAWVKVYTTDSYELKEVDMVDELGKPMGKKTIRVLKDFGQRKLSQLWYSDAGTFLYDIDAFRRIRGFWQ